MANKRINSITATVEEMEWILGIPEGHHIEYVEYDPQRRTIRFYTSGNSMTETHPGYEVVDMRLARAQELFRNRRKKFIEPPL